jgi:hypothetical protein
VSYHLPFVPHIRPLLINLNIGTSRGRQNRRPDGAQHFFRS